MIFALVPAYNEEERIGSVVRSLFKHVDMVVVVDDGSNDDTALCARAHGAVVLRHILNRGQGAALQTGHEYLQSTEAHYIVHFDGDGQFEEGDIQKAVNHLREHEADVLFGTRYGSVVSDIPWTKRYIVHRGARFVQRVLGAPPLTDAHNGFRVLTKSALSFIVITQDRMAHASEIPYLVRFHGLKHVEFPIHVVYHRYGQRMRSGLTVLKDLLIGRFIK